MDTDKTVIAKVESQKLTLSNALIALILFPLVLPLAIINVLFKNKVKEKREHSNIIKKFVQKYGEQSLHFDTVSSQPYLNLKELLKVKGLNYTDDDLSKRIYEEFYEQDYKNFSKRVELVKPKDKDDYIKAFIQIYGDLTGEKEGYLIRLLKDKGLFTDAASLRVALQNIQKKLELDHFEKSLTDTSVSITNISLMSGLEFEEFLEKLFSKMGYKVELTKRSGDQGADLIVERMGERMSVQAKRSAGKVGNKAIQEAVASIKHYECSSGMVITNSDFTGSAYKLAKSNKIDLINGSELRDLIQKYF